MRRLLLALVLVTAREAWALDPQRSPTQYVITRWDEAAGLPSRSVHALRQTRDRYLFVGTAAGLARFDGARFTIFDARNTPDFGDGIVSRLAEGADGTLYVGTTSAVLRRRAGRFEPLPIRTGAGVVGSLLQAREGTLWIGILGRPLHLWRDERVTPLTKELGTLTPEAMIEDAAGVVLIGTRDKGLLRFADGRFDRDPDVTDPIQALFLDRSGTLWIGTPRGLLRKKDGGLARLTPRDGLSHENITSILEDRDGSLWVGTAGGGLNRLRDGRWAALTIAEGLSGNDVRALLEDDEGSLWVGTADGLDRLSDGRFVTYGATEGLPDSAVSAIDGHEDGSVWVGTASSGLSRLRGGEVRHFRWPRGPGPQGVLVVFAARDGSVWAGADDGRLFRVKDDIVTDETPIGVSGRVTAIYEDEGGPMFFLRGSGLVRIRNRRVEVVHRTATQLSYLYDAVRDRSGTLWLCGSVGLGRLRGGDFRRFTEDDGLPHDRVRSATEDEDGGLWLATIGGLAFIEGDTIRRATTREGLPENHLRLVLDDGRGFLWIAAAGRIFRVAKRELRDLFAGRIAKVSPLLFDSSDGLRSTETRLSSALGFRAADGRLWFATTRGASVVDPQRLSAADPAPPVVIEDFRIDGRSESAQDYRPGRGELTAEYTTLTLRAPRQMRFRHRLLGFDHDWRDSGKGRRIHYGTLPAGAYRLLVEASNRDGVFLGAPAQVAVSIRPPFHHTWTFYALCAAVLAALTVGAHRLRVAQVHARFAAILGERTRIARELHDTLAQSLTGMGMQIEAALGTIPPDLGRARGHLRRARSMVSASLADVRRSIWVLRAQAERSGGDLAASLSASLAQLASDSGARLSVDVGGPPRALPAEIERNLLRIAHEAVTNAVRHSEASRIDVAVRFDDDGVHLRVHDDGRGFDPAAASPRRGDHFGLLGMAERAQVMRGELHVRSRPGAGTEVDCRLPYQPPPA